MAGRPPKLRNKAQIQEYLGVGEDRLNSIIDRLSLTPVKIEPNGAKLYTGAQVAKMKLEAKRA